MYFDAYVRSIGSDKDSWIRKISGEISMRFELEVLFAGWESLMRYGYESGGDLKD